LSKPSDFIIQGRNGKPEKTTNQIAYSTPATSATAMGISANTNENTPKNIDDYLQIPVQYNTFSSNNPNH
jgi:hypothetical protein